MVVHVGDKELHFAQPPRLAFMKIFQHQHEHKRNQRKHKVVEVAGFGAQVVGDQLGIDQADCEINDRSGKRGEEVFPGCDSHAHGCRGVQPF